jgi:hypothetical protein
MSHPLPPYITLEAVHQRLLRIFPQGSEYNYCTRDIAAKTLFAMLYVGAVQGTGRMAAPKHIYRMSDEQAAIGIVAERIAYASEVRKPKFASRGPAWYADNTREPIRDETLRQGFITVGATIEDSSVPTTSNKPRYMVTQEFAALFDPSLVDPQLEEAIQRWRATHLSKAALMKVALERAGAAHEPGGVQVEFPNKETRRLTPGKSSVITKAVVEEFAPRFLKKPVVLSLSESGNKVVARDEVLARKIGINIDPSKNLPDVILVDLGGQGEEALVVFVEVVATDGYVSDTRRKNLLSLLPPGLTESHAAFVTAFMARDEPSLKKAFASLAWNSFVWVASEPEQLVALIGAQGSTSAKIHDVLAVTKKSQGTK